MAYSNCWGLKPGGVAITTISTSSLIACLYPSSPPKIRPSTSILSSPYFFLKPSILRALFSGKASATATSFVLQRIPFCFSKSLGASKIWEIAPDPRPPRPIAATRIVSLLRSSPRATYGKEAAAPANAEVPMNFLRVTISDSFIYIY